MADIEQIEVTWPDDSATYRRGYFFCDCSSSNPFKPKKVNKLCKPNKFKHLSIALRALVHYSRISSITITNPNNQGNGGKNCQFVDSEFVHVKACNRFPSHLLYVH